jgi:hypothetical protein
MLRSGNYTLLTEGVRSRLNPDRLTLNKSFTDELSTISYSDVLVYIRYAMKGVEPEYTQKSKQAGENAKTHLDILSDKEFRFQGSVMTNTHIKAHSDIDLLVISTKFYTWDRHDSERYINEQEFRSKLWNWQIAKLEKEKNYFNVYEGNLYQDLAKLRSDSESILRDKYKICDTTGAKSIKITNLDLKRDVDVVIANWYDDVRSIINDRDENRGVQVYNKETNSRENADYPFISIKKINERGSSTNGRLKKMIRFIKNVKADSDLNIDLSSFDINAICYDIDTAKYQNASFIELIPVIYNQLKSICTDTNHANNVVSVDDREYIFRFKPGKIENIRKVLTEVESIYLSVKQINQYI